MADSVRRVIEIDVKAGAEALAAVREMQSRMKELEDAARGVKGELSDLNGAFKSAGDAASRFVQALKDQVATFGYSKQQLLEYKAAQLGVADSVRPLIEQLGKLEDAQRDRNAEDAKTAAIAAAIRAANDRMIADGNRLVAGLQKQIDTFGLSGNALTQYQANLLGVGNAVTPLLTRLSALNDAELERARIAAQAAAAEANSARVQQSISSSRESLISGLREQIATFGLSGTELDRYRARLLGISKEVDPLIAKLDELNRAETASATAARQQQEAANAFASAVSQQRNSIDEYIASLKEEIATLGLSARQRREYELSKLGPQAEIQARPLLQQLDVKQENVDAQAAERARLDAATKSLIATQQQYVADGNRLVKQTEDEIAQFGLAGDALDRYRASLLGVSDRMEPLIAQRAALRNAAKAEAEAEEQARLAQAEKDAQARRTQQTGEQIILSLKEQIALLKDGADAVLLAKAAEAGRLTEAQQLLATLNQLKAAEEAKDKATRDATRSTREAESAERARANSQKSFIQNLRDTVATQDLGTKGRLTYQAQQLGINTNEGSEAAKLINQIKAGGHEVDQSASFMERFRLNTVGAHRELLVLSHELSQGNFKQFGGSLIVLGERMDIARYLFTATGLAALGFAAAIGGIIYLIIKGVAEQERFNQNLLLTGNYAGQTAASFHDLTVEISRSSGVTQSNAKDILNSLLATGRYGPEALASVGRAAANLERVTGESSEKVISEFAGMEKGISDWAIKSNEKYHFLTLADYDYIKSLEDHKQVDEAVKFTSDKLSEALDKQNENVGTLVQAYRALKDILSGVKEAFENLGKEFTPSQQYKETLDQIKQARIQLLNEPGGLDYERQRDAGLIRAPKLTPNTSATDAEKESLYQQIQALKRVADAQRPAAEAEEAAAKAKSDYARANELAINSEREFQRVLESGKGDALYNKRVTQFLIDAANIRKANQLAQAQGKPVSTFDVSDEAILRGIAIIREQTLSKDQRRTESAFKAEFNALTEEAAKLKENIFQYQHYGDAIDHAREAAVAAAIAEGKLKGLPKEEQDRLIAAAKLVDDLQRQLYGEKALANAEKIVNSLKIQADAHAQNARETEIANKIAEVERQGLVAGMKGYDDVTASIRRFVEAKHDAALVRQLRDLDLKTDEQVQKINAETAALTKNTLERQQNAAAEKIYSDAKTARLLEDNPGQADLIKSNLDFRVKEMTDALARLYNEQRSFDVGATISFQKYAEEAGNAAKFAETFIGGSLGRLEDVFVNFVNTGKLSFSDLFKFMADEFIRQYVRMKVAGSLKELFPENKNGTASDNPIVSGAKKLFGVLFPSTTAPAAGTETTASINKQLQDIFVTYGAPNLSKEDFRRSELESYKTLTSESTSPTERLNVGLSSTATAIDALRISVDTLNSTIAQSFGVRTGAVESAPIFSGPNGAQENFRSLELESYKKIDDAANNASTSLDSLSSNTGGLTGSFADITTSIDGFGNDFGQMFGDLSAGFGDLFKSLDSGTGGSLLSSIGAGLDSIFFAKGGIATPHGALPLSAYTDGGIADKPQVTVFGEGRTPEAFIPLADGKNVPVKVVNEGGIRKAYVPLPDGRAIPVALQIDGRPQTDIKMFASGGVQTASGPIALGSGAQGVGLYGRGGGVDFDFTGLTNAIASLTDVIAGGASRVKDYVAGAFSVDPQEAFRSREFQSLRDAGGSFATTPSIPRVEIPNEFAGQPSLGLSEPKGSVLQGLVETGGTLATSVPAFAYGSLVGLSQLLQGNKDAERLMAESIAANTYAPRTQRGQAYTGAVGELVNQVGLPLAGLGGTFTGVNAASRQFATDVSTRVAATLAESPIIKTALSPGGASTDLGLGIPKSDLGAIIYHGSPNKFDRFDPSKIGSGEGFQSEGHGLYFSENPFVADWYARNVSYQKNLFPNLEGTTVPLSRATTQMLFDRLPGPLSNFSTQADALSAVTDFLKRTRDNTKGWDADPFSHLNRQIESELPALDSLRGADLSKLRYGYVYKAEVPDSILKRTLDLDKPLMHQATSETRNVLNTAGNVLNFDLTNYHPAKATGLYAYDEISNAINQLEHPISYGEPYGEPYGASAIPFDAPDTGYLKTSNLLSDFLNIPGNRYLDQFSRTGRVAKDEQTSNFVLFPSTVGNVDLLTRNGSPVGQRGAIDIASIQDAISKFQDGLLKPLELLDSFKGTFNTKAIDNLKSDVLDPKARSTLAFMSPDEFLSFAERRFSPSDEKRQGVREGLQSNEGLRSLPQLFTDLNTASDTENARVVTGHEGRHRMDVFKDLGVNLVPVEVRDGTLRWGERNASDYPTELLNQNRDQTFPFPSVATIPRDQRGSVDPTILGDALVNLKEYLGNVSGILKDEAGKAVIAFRGNHTSEHPFNEARKDYAVFSSDNPYLASEYATFGRGANPSVTPFVFSSDAKLIDFPVKKGGQFDKFGFDQRANRLGDKEVLVARNSTDYGPGSGEDYPFNRGRFGGDQFAFKDASVAKPLTDFTANAGQYAGDISEATAEFKNKFIETLKANIAELQKPFEEGNTYTTYTLQSKNGNGTYFQDFTASAARSEVERLQNQLSAATNVGGTVPFGQRGAIDLTTIQNSLAQLADGTRVLTNQGVGTVVRSNRNQVLDQDALRELVASAHKQAFQPYVAGQDGFENAVGRYQNLSDKIENLPTKTQVSYLVQGEEGRYRVLSEDIQKVFEGPQGIVPRGQKGGIDFGLGEAALPVYLTASATSLTPLTSERQAFETQKEAFRTNELSTYGSEPGKTDFRQYFKSFEDLFKGIKIGPSEIVQAISGHPESLATNVLTQVAKNYIYPKFPARTEPRLVAGGAYDPTGQAAQEDFRRSELQSAVTDVSSELTGLSKNVNNTSFSFGSLIDKAGEFGSSLVHVLGSIGSGAGSSGGGLFGFLGGLFGAGAAGVAASPAAQLAAGVIPVARGGIVGTAGALPLAAFAYGGVMTDFGKLMPEFYSEGGITRAGAPRLAVFGEGRRNEAFIPLADGKNVPVNVIANAGQQKAFVPLPDGRSIPVKLNIDSPAKELKAFAYGGIMSPFGVLPLRAYADGGVSSSQDTTLYGATTSPFVPTTRLTSPQAAQQTQGRSGPDSIRFEVVNNTGTPARASRVERKSDGSYRVVLDAIRDQLGNEIDNGYGLADNIGSRFGLRGANGLRR